MNQSERERQIAEKKAQIAARLKQQQAQQQQQAQRRAEPSPVTQTSRQRDVSEDNLFGREIGSENEFEGVEDTTEFLRSIIIGQAIAEPRGNFYRKFR